MPLFNCRLFVAARINKVRRGWNLDKTCNVTSHLPLLETYWQRSPNFEKNNFRALLISYMTYNTSLYLNSQRMWARRHEEEIWLMISSLIWTWEPSMWPSVWCPTDRILLVNKNFDWFYDILVNFSYFHLKIVRYVAMNVENLMHQAILRRTCLKFNPKANINSVSHWPGDDCKGDLKKISVIIK